MASLKTIKLKSGEYYQIVYRLNDKAEYLNLNKNYSRSYAQKTVLPIIEDLVKSLETGADLRKSTLAFIEDDCKPDLKKKLVDKGLIQSEENERMTIAELFSNFLDYPSDRKERTLITLKTSYKRFMKVVDSDNLLAKELSSREYQKAKNDLLRLYSPATVAGTLKAVITAFNWAIEQKYLKEMPFNGVTRGSFVNESRWHFVSMQDYQRLLAACPCQDWRTLLALCRIGGLRNPSETLILTWKSLDWKSKTVKVFSPKLERFEGKAYRIIPMFPELEEELKRSKKATKNIGDNPNIITSLAGSKSNLRSQFYDITRRAGLDQIPAPFKNLRRSRETELQKSYPLADVCDWIGNSTSVAQKHYLMPLKESFQRAISEKTEIA